MNDTSDICVQIYQRKRLETLRKSVFGESEDDKDGSIKNHGKKAILRRLKKSKGCAKLSLLQGYIFIGTALEKKMLIQKLLASDGYGNHLDEAAVEEILAGLETSDEEGGSSSGEDVGDDGDMGNLDGGDFDEEAGEEDGDDDDGGGDEDDDDEEDEASSSEERYLFYYLKKIQSKENDC